MLIITAFDFILYICIGIDLFKQNGGNALYIILTTSVTTLLLLYSLSFLFSTPQIAFGCTMFIFLILFLAVTMIDSLRGTKGDKVVPYVYGLIPVTNVYYGLTKIGTLQKLSFGQCFKIIKPTMIFALVDIPIYALILFAIEKLRILIAKHRSSKQYSSLLQNINLPQRNTPADVEEMENLVRSGTSFDITAINVSRLFVDDKKQPIVAVNNLTLGVKHGEIFGFLGANGAGKTTMISMISGALPMSSGDIKLCGESVENALKHNSIALCPQTNNHLTPELTPTEQLKLFSVLYNLDAEEAANTSFSLIDELKITTTHKEESKSCGKGSKIREALTRELSGGNQRKLALAVAMLSPATIVLLDEPTASLDPDARIHVHNLIRDQRGKRTVLLCTHLIEEAEELCDNISIMLHGQLYAIGSPQQLSSKYGTEWNVQIETNETPDSNDLANQFMEQNFASATKIKESGRNITYGVPVSDASLIEMFDKLNSGVGDAHGIKYFTCCTSTLEKAFIELILKSNEEM